MAEKGWPCDLRVLHDEHEVQWAQRHSEGTSTATTERGSYTCPGVKAHPSTMIGKQRAQ